jgi:hypothetical protein
MEKTRIKRRTLVTVLETQLSPKGYRCQDSHLSPKDLSPKLNIETSEILESQHSSGTEIYESDCLSPDRFSVSPNSRSFITDGELRAKTRGPKRAAKILISMSRSGA